MSADRGDGLRAIFLAAIMVLSVVAMGVAFSGTAAAASGDKVTLSGSAQEDVYPANVHPETSDGKFDGSGAPNVTNEISPVSVTLSPDADNYSDEKVRVVVQANRIDGSEAGLELWAQNSSNDWINMTKTGWGPSEGFVLDGDRTTEVYPAGSPGVYDVTLQVINKSGDGETLESVSGTISIGLDSPTSYSQFQGNTLTVASGTYNENVTVSTNKITLEGPNSGTPGYADRNDEATINGQVVIEADNATFNGFDVSPPNATSNPKGEAVRISGGADDVVVKNNIVRDFGEDGVPEGEGIGGIVAFGGDSSDAVSDVTITQNKVHHISGRETSGGTSGISIQGNVAGATVEDNVVKKIGLQKTAYGFGIVVRTTSDLVPIDVEINNNDISKVLSNPETSTSGVGIGLEGGENVVFNDNQIQNTEFLFEDKTASVDLDLFADNNKLDQGALLEGATRNIIFNSIDQAASAAADGDVIDVEPGTYKGRVNIGKDISLIGSGQDNTIISANSSDVSKNHDPTVSIYADATIKNLSIIREVTEFDNDKHTKALGISRESDGEKTKAIINNTNVILTDKTGNDTYGNALWINSYNENNGIRYPVEADLNNVDVENDGIGPKDGFGGAAIAVYAKDKGVKLNVHASNLHDSVRGLYVLEDNATADVKVTNTNIIENKEYAIINHGETKINATSNWWGSEYGPSAGWDNRYEVKKQGANVTGPVKFTPWLTSPEGDQTFAPIEIAETNETFASIQNAINVSGADETVALKPGNYTESFHLDEENVTVTSVGSPEETVIDPPEGAWYTAFNLRNDEDLGEVTVEELTLKSGDRGTIGQNTTTGSGVAINITNNIIEAPPSGWLEWGSTVWVTGNNSVIAGNEIQTAGFSDSSVKYSARGVFINNASHVEVLDNEIYSVSSTASSGNEVGVGVDSYAPQSQPDAFENYIGHNHVHHVDVGVSVIGETNRTFIHKNTINQTANAVQVVSWTDEHEFKPEQTILRLNNIYENSDNSLVIYSDDDTASASVDAKANWWGSDGGLRAAAGTNDIGNVHYVPYLTAPHQLIEDQDNIQQFAHDYVSDPTEPTAFGFPGPTEQTVSDAFRVDESASALYEFNESTQVWELVSGDDWDEEINALDAFVFAPESQSEVQVVYKYTNNADESPEAKSVSPGFNFVAAPSLDYATDAFNKPRERAVLYGGVYEHPYGNSFIDISSRDDSFVQTNFDGGRNVVSPFTGYFLYTEEQRTIPAYVTPGVSADEIDDVLRNETAG